MVREILVVDDDPDICEAVQDILEEAGFVVTCTRNGREAIEHLTTHAPPGLILLDLLMPEMDGWRFVARARALPGVRDVPIVVMTGNGAHWGYPVPNVLRKPVGYNHLMLTVRNALADSPGQSAGGP